MTRYFVILAVLLAALPAASQDLEQYQQRQQDLAALAGLFGEMHHIRRTCEPRFEADTWRDRMKKLIDLEEPQDSEREVLIARFNNGYRAAQRRFPTCDRRARDYAAGRAAEGDVIVARLMQQLRETEGDENDYTASPYLIAPSDE